MKDPFFERTVVLVWHHDEDGAIGVVVNRELAHTLPEVLDLPEDTDVDLAPYQESNVGWGGPVETGSGTVITTGAVDQADGWVLAGGLSVTRSQQVLMGLIREARPILLCLGYAGWGPGQLDQELENGGWLFCDLDAEIVFGDTSESCYQQALTKLGLSENTVWMQPIQE